MKHLRKFNEGLFGSKKEDELSDDLKPKGLKSTTPRPEWKFEKPEIKKGGIEQRVDPYFLQEVSDRLYGPDSEKYVKALEELHKETDENGQFKYRPRPGRYGSQFYEPENVRDKYIKRSE